MVFFIVGFLGKGGGHEHAETRVLLDYVGHRLTLCNCESDDPAETKTQCNVRPTHIPVHSLKLTRTSSSLVCQWFFVNPTVPRPKPGAIQPRIIHWPWYPIRHECYKGPAKKFGICIRLVSCGMRKFISFLKVLVRKRNSFLRCNSSVR